MPIQSFSSRQRREEKFHDDWAASVGERELFFRQSFESPTAVENQCVLSSLGEISGKRILDLGCGLGDATIYFAKRGASVDAVDISGKMIALVKRFADREKIIEKISAKKMTAENLSYPDETFDFVYGNGILHHVDFKKAAGEVQRVLKRGGRAYFVEPLRYNPVINIYRSIAKEVRTIDEKPLTFDDIACFGDFFRKYHHKEFHLFTQLIFLWFFFVKGSNPNKERYWKKILLEGDKYRFVFNFLYKMDSIFLKFIPVAGRFCWNTVISVQK